MTAMVTSCSHSAGADELHRASFLQIQMNRIVNAEEQEYSNMADKE